MSDSDAEKIELLLRRQDKESKRLKFKDILAIAFFFSCIPLGVYLFDNTTNILLFILVWTVICIVLSPYYYKTLTLRRMDVLNLMELSKDTPDARQELVNRLLSGNILTDKDKSDIEHIVNTEQEKKSRLNDQNNDRKKIEAFLEE
ncbi:TPA: hypothetical protein ACXKGF_001416 [Escherichia coli]